MSDWTQTSIFAIIQIVMLIGLFGLIVPIFPGLVVIWLAALGYGIVTGFTTLGWVLFGIITVLMLIGAVVDNLFMGAGARRGGASWMTIIVALLAGVLGTLLFPPIGGVIAAPLAILLLEYTRQRDWQKAWQALRGLATGFGLSIIVRFGIGLLMMILWWVWAAN